jgi:hypothetical protein
MYDGMHKKLAEAGIAE